MKFTELITQKYFFILNRVDDLHPYVHINLLTTAHVSSSLRLEQTREDPDQMPQDAASDQGLQCLPLIHQCFGTVTGSKYIVNIEILEEYGKEFLDLNTQGKYSMNSYRVRLRGGSDGSSFDLKLNLTREILGKFDKFGMSYLP